MNIQVNNNKLYTKGLQKICSYFCKLCCALLFSPVVMSENRLILLTPDSEGETVQEGTTIIEPEGTTKVELNKSVKKNNKKKVSIADWSNPEGFKFTNKYQENSSDFSESQPDMLLSTATWSAKVKVPINSILTANGEFNIGKFTPGSRKYNFQQVPQRGLDYLGDLEPYQTSQDLKNTNIKLGLSAKTSLINYGLDYSSVGSEYDAFNDKPKRKDRAAFKYWVSKKFHDLTLESSYSTEWDNLDLDHEKSRLTDSLIGIKSTYNISKWPYSSLSISYQTGKQESSYDPEGRKGYTGDINRVSTDFYMSGDNFSISLGSSVDIISDDFEPSNNKKLFYNYISTSYFYSGFYLTPSIYSSDNFYDNSSYVYKTLGSSVSLSYKPKSSPYGISLYTSQVSNKSNDKFTFNNSFTSGVSLDWRIMLSQKDEQILTFKIESYQYDDYIYSDSSNSKLFFGINWQLISL